MIELIGLEITAPDPGFDITGKRINRHKAGL